MNFRIKINPPSDWRIFIVLIAFFGLVFAMGYYGGLRSPAWDEVEWPGKEYKQVSIPVTVTYVPQVLTNATISKPEPEPIIMARDFREVANRIFAFGAAIGYEVKQNGGTYEHVQKAVEFYKADDTTNYLAMIKELREKK